MNSLKLGFISILLGLIFFSCKKDSNSNVPKVFDIATLTIDSNRIVTSIDTIIAHPSGCGMIPSPSDSLDVDSLDLDLNVGIDAYVSAKSWYQFVSASYPCANYCHSLIFGSVQNKVEFTKSGMYNQVGLINENETIDSTKEWMGSITLSLYVPNAHFSCGYQGINYVGFRVLKNSGYQYGWLKVKATNYGVSIVSGALNQTVDMGIPAGKKTN